MNIYSVKRTDTIGWDEYDSFVCYAKTEKDARSIFPHSSYERKVSKFNEEGAWDNVWDSSWVMSEDIDSLAVTLIGTSDKVEEEKIIVSSFNAG